MRLGLSARKTALQSVVLVIYRLQGQVPVARWRRKTASRQTQSLARFTGKGCHLVAKGQSGTLWEETKAWALENRRHMVEEGDGLYSLVFEGRPRRVPVECGWDGTGLPA